MKRPGIPPKSVPKSFFQERNGDLYESYVSVLEEGEV
jgi:hypothetical protein